MYQPRLSDDEIHDIISSALPEAVYVSHKAFSDHFADNNRLYEVRVRTRTSCLRRKSSNDVDGTSQESVAQPVIDTEDQEQALVLKACRRFWKGYKTINEVMCLKLIAQTCPEIPVPRVVAWFAPALSSSPSTALGIPGKEGTSEKEWILMMKLPGRPLHEAALFYPAAVRPGNTREESRMINK